MIYYKRQNLAESKPPVQRSNGARWDEKAARTFFLKGFPEFGKAGERQGDSRKHRRRGN